MKRTLLAATTALAMVVAGATGVNAKELRWGFQTDTDSLDPHAHAVTFTIGFLGNVYEGLVRRDGDLAIEPALAESWTVSDDATVWRFKLRKGVKFHNGNDFNADDVLFSYKRISDPDAQMKTNVASVKEVRKIDDHTIEFITKSPNPILTGRLNSVFIMDKEWSEENGATKVTVMAGDKEKVSPAGQMAMGTGAFIIKDRTAQVKTTLVPNPNWWDKATHNLTKVTMTPVKQDSTRVAALLSGELDMAYPVPTQDIKRVNSNSGTSVLVGPELRTIFIFMDQNGKNLYGTDTKNPFLDKRVRQALYQSINIEAIKKKIMRGLSTPSAIMISPLLYDRSGEFNRYAYDPAASKKLLADAGYGGGLSARFDCPNDRYVNDEQICQAVTSMAAKVGIKLNLTAKPKAQYFKQVLDPKKRDYHVGLIGWTPGSFDSHNVVTSLISSYSEEKKTGRYNLSNHSDARIDALDGMIQSESDKTKRDAMIAEVYKLVHDNVYYIPLHQQALAWGKRDNISLTQRGDNVFRFRYVTIN
ncbi:MAG: ABC transporter substrate-binding protein [Rhodospirillaceae bacterium]|jgi:peptide/nickel transport system substrate-binding protein|nr:ABC transporter substrate-binding protein [Rhodospirillaceae bacterium]MBT5192163.1 ABC transporter substrate-binding protein [Rhodospirillaceae bacterium]MBT6426781.1 ABC transporter substrate-binding protein [Rhodospirillaceae bacterium]